MIARIRGQVVEKGLDTVIVDVGGVGYEVAVSATDYGSMAVGEETSLHIHEQIREDTHNLFGFSNAPAKQFFEQLISINGVGPKVAMNVLSAAALPQLQSAIVAGDPELLRGVAGIGKKTADRIMLELRGKVDAPAGGMVMSPLGTNDPAYQALIGLGYKPAQAAEAVAALPADIADEQARVRAALQSLRG